MLQSALELMARPGAETTTEKGVAGGGGGGEGGGKGEGGGGLGLGGGEGGGEGGLGRGGEGKEHAGGNQRKEDPSAPWTPTCRVWGPAAHVVAAELMEYLVMVAENETKSWATLEKSTGGQEPRPGRQLHIRVQQGQ